MLKRLMLLGALALVLAAPAQAHGWKQLRVRGVVVSASAEVVAVENFVGDATLKCRVPERLADKAAAFKPGDKVRMLCFRKRGQRAVLYRLWRLGENAEERGEKNTGTEPREKPDKPKPEEAAARGAVAELGPNAIVVVDAESGRRLACKVSAEKAPKLEGLKVGDRVKILCLNGQLAYLERAVPETTEKPKPEEAAARGAVAELGPNAIVVVDAESGRRLACRVSAEKAPKLEGLKVGDRVKILCLNGQLTYLERAAAEEVKLYGTITALSTMSVSVTGDGRTLTCRVPTSFAEKLGSFALGNSVKMMCRGTELTYLEKA